MSNDSAVSLTVGFASALLLCTVAPKLFADAISRGNTGEAGVWAFLAFGPGR